MPKKKLRPFSHITGEMEHLLEEMTDPNGHDMQWHEVLYAVYGWLKVHAPHAQETYTADGSHPVFHYGPPIELEKSSENKPLKKDES